MLKQILMMSALTGALVLTSGFAFADDQEYSQKQDKTQKKEWIYGSQLMTEQERAEHRSKMHAAKTAEEREQIRKEHHERMKARAKERGVSLPDEPPAKGKGMMGPGGGMGSGGGGMKPDSGGY